MRPAALYISYTGMLEPLGQSQVLAYQERLTKDRAIYLISFERKEDWSISAARQSMEDRMRLSGIRWHPLRYHKRPSVLATPWDILRGGLLATWLGVRHRIGIVHARSYVTSLMALPVKRLVRAKFVFDMRGFWADERVDGGLWPRGGRMYRLAKWFERRFLLSADHVVSLTRAAVAEMREFEYLQGRMPPTTVIPTCADLEMFSPGRGVLDERFTLGYVGSAGTWYLFDAAVAAFQAVRRHHPDARFLIINWDAHTYIRERLAAGGVPMDSVELRQAAHAEVPGQMRRMHAGVFFIKPVFSKQASAPTKLAEFLGCGVPCLSNTGVGDMAHVLVGDRVGVAVDATDADSLAQGVEDLLELCATSGIAERCAASARRHFSLDEGVERYRAIYSSLERLS